jgi:PAS domain S-box-containing protein
MQPLQADLSGFVVIALLANSIAIFFFWRFLSRRSRNIIKAMKEKIAERTQKLQATNEEMMATNEELSAANEELNALNDRMTLANLLIQEQADVIIKQKEEALRRSEEYLDIVFSNTSEEIVLMDQEGRILMFNDALQQFLRDATGNTPVVGMYIWDATVEERKHISKALFARALDGEVLSTDATFVTSRGKVVHELRYQPVREQGYTKFVVLTAVDITTRKQSEAQLALSASIIDHSSDAIISKDIDSVITSWNRSAERIFGYAAAEMIGRSIAIVIPPERLHEEAEIIKKILKGEYVGNYETVRLRKDGSFVDVSLTVSPVRDSSGQITGASKIVRDITERKEFERQKERTTDELINRNKDLEHFAYIVSHNLRAPVANIIGISNLLNVPTLQADQRSQVISGITSSARKLDEVIVDLNHVLKVKHDVNEKRETVSFSALVEDIRISISSLINSGKVTIVTDFGEVDEYPTIKSYLHSVFYNLISNSIKYRRPDLDPIIRIKSKRLHENLVLTFSDNGIGIDLNKHGDKVFGLYRRFHPNEAEGKGMGLYMVKSQVEALGGKISISSEVDHGTEFTIVLNI